MKYQTFKKREPKMPNPQSKKLFENMDQKRFYELAGVKSLTEQAKVDTDTHEFQMLVKDLAHAALIFAQPEVSAQDTEAVAREAIEEWLEEDATHYLYLLQQAAQACNTAAKKLEGMLRADEKESTSGTAA